MNYLSAENISKSYGDQLLFEGISFGMSRGDKTALIAQNGVGKTTLLRILAGIESTDSGEFTMRNGIKTAFLEQSPELDASLTIQELIQSSNTPVLELIHAYEKAMEAHTLHPGSESQRAFDEATNEMDLARAWDYERRLKQLLDLFRITDTTQRIGLLSGGEKKRLALALVLLDEPEMLILDEPTNHLDIDMIEWLEKHLGQTNITLLMVTHDRYFLDRVCNNILEIESKQLYSYKGNYEYFLRRRAERTENRQIHADRASQLLKKELEWLRRMPKARTSKSKARIDSIDGIKDTANSVSSESELKLHMKAARLGGKVLELSRLQKKFDKLNIIDDFSYKFSKGDRIGIIGRNGTGKSTFLNIISGLEAPDSGEIDRGETVVMGYYTQMGLDWKKDQRVIDRVKDIAEVVMMGDGRSISAAQFLDHFMFPPETQYKMISKLSGGELRRLHLLTVLIKSPNFLILDEPTNDLDLLALNKLEEFLLAYKGCLIIVSHDRYFLDKLSDHLFIFEGDGAIKDFYGKYSIYRERKEEERKQRAKIATENKSKTAGISSKNLDEHNAEPRQKTKLTFKEKHEYAGLEKEIERLEIEKATLEKELNKGTLDYESLNTHSSKVAELIDLIEVKTLRWMELGEYL